MVEQASGLKWRPSVVDVMAAVVFSVAIWPLGGHAAPRELKYKDVVLDLKSGDKLAILCPRAFVKLTGTGGAQTVLHARKSLPEKAPADAVTRFDALSFNVHRDGTLLTLECSGADAKPGSGDFHFDIDGASVAIEMAVREGGAAVQSWRQPISAVVVEGSVRSNQTEGAFLVQLQRGEVKIEGHKGRLDVEAQSVKLQISNLEGDLKVVNFAGDSALSEINGNVDAKLDSGSLSMAKSAGSLDFVLGRGSLTAQGFEGALKGEVQSGNVQADLNGEADVNIESDRGSVVLKAPPQSGALIRLQTNEGALALPQGIKPTPGNARSANTRLLGNGSKGTIIVRSKTGSIRLRD